MQKELFYNLATLSALSFTLGFITFLKIGTTQATQKKKATQVKVYKEVSQSQLVEDINEGYALSKSPKLL